MAQVPTLVRTRGDVDIKCLQFLVQNDANITTQLNFIRYIDQNEIGFFFAAMPSAAEIAIVDAILTNYEFLSGNCGNNGAEVMGITAAKLAEKPASWNVEYGESGNIGNEFLRTVNRSSTADRSCWIAPWNCRIVGIMANQRNTSGRDELWVMRLPFDGDRNDVPDLLYQKAFSTTIMEFYDNNLDIRVNQSDKIAVFMRDRGNDTRDVFCNIFYTLDQEDPGVAQLYEYDRNTSNSVFSPWNRPEYNNPDDDD